MKRFNLGQWEWLIVAGLFIAGTAGSLCVAQAAIALPPTWSVSAKMSSQLDPDATFTGNAVKIAPLLPEIMTPPPWNEAALLQPEREGYTLVPVAVFEPSTSLPASISGRTPLPTPTSSPIPFAGVTLTPPVSSPVSSTSTTRPAATLAEITFTPSATPASSLTTTPKPTQTPQPTQPGKTPKPSKTPKPTNPPKPTDPPKPTKPPKPTDPPKPTKPPKPTDPPEPTDPPKPTKPPKPTDPPKPTKASRP